MTMTDSKIDGRNKSRASTVKNDDFVTVRLAGQLVGIPVLSVHDVLSPQKITFVPHAPESVAGVLNLRGRIVTAIDLRRRLGLPPRENGQASMSVVIEHNGDPYSLQIDSVGEVLSLSSDVYERNPVSLDQVWQVISNGIYKLDGELIVVLDIDRLLDFGLSAAA
jgi:purine-binding chemotaxis protein CheW